MKFLQSQSVVRALNLEMMTFTRVKAMVILLPESDVDFLLLTSF